MALPPDAQLAPLARAARSTEVRVRTREALSRLWLGLIPTLLALGGVVLHAKLTHGARGPWFLGLVGLTAACGLATLAAVVWAYVRKYPAYAGAILLDRAFDNRDRVTSALSFAKLPDDQRTPLMDAAIDDALAHAKPLKPAVAAPLLVAFLTGDAAFVVVLALLVGGLGSLQWSRRITTPKAQTIDAVSLSPDDVDLFRDTLKELEQKDPSPETQAALLQFNQLVEDIAQKRLDRTEAFRRMESLEKALAKGREADAKALDEALKSTAEKLKDSPLSKPAGEALAKKDFAAAEKELKELAAKLRDKQSKITEADKKRLKEALANAAKKQKETLAKLSEQREQLRASLLQREQKAGAMNDEEKRLLQRDKRELDRLDREIAEKEKAGRALDRLDRELSQAAEDLMRELGLSAEDLERAAEDLNRMAKEEMTEQEKEELRQRLQELKELLRQEGAGGEELRKRLRKFAKKARGKGQKGDDEEQGGGKKGQKGDKGEQGEGEGDEEGDEGEDGQKGKGKKGKGQEGEGEGEGKGPGGKKSFVLKSGNRPGQGPGQGPGGMMPGGSGEKPGGKQFGTGHDPNVAGKTAGGRMGTQQDVQEAATDTGQGASVSETILSASEKGFASRPYKKVYADYRTKAEEAMKNEDIPPGYKFYVQRYFQLIRPRELDPPKERFPMSEAANKDDVAWFTKHIGELREEIGKVIVGNREVVDGALTCMLVGSHALLEGVPGLGKTLLVRTMAEALSLTFSRVQFTPDLMPADILGTTMITEAAGGGKQFEFRKGPIFANIVLADEINRATPKTQSALLEAMQEHSVTVARTTHILEEPFLVLATQNPLESEGTYPLPEAQLDRFFFKLHVTFPNREELHAIMDRTTAGVTTKVTPVLGQADVLRMQKLVRQVPAARHVQDYAIRLLQATHPEGPDAPEMVKRYVRFGASPRGGQACVLAAKIRALFDGRFAASIDDVKVSALPALRHRVLLNFEGEAEGVKTDQVLTEIIKRLPEGKA